MKKTKKALASLAIAGMVLSMAPMSVFGADATNRISDLDRVGTAIAIANNGWAAGADSVIVVPADDANIVDALAAAPLAGQLNAPILVTYKGALDAKVQQKIVDLGAKNVYAIGALSDDVVNSLKAISGVTVEQLQGADRTETAAKVAAKLTKVNGTFVVAYDGKADALSAASFAAANSYSIVIANPDGTIPSNEAAYKVAPTYTVGGQVTVEGATVLAGADRYATNNEVLDGLEFNYDKVYVANGQSLVDALAGAPLAAQTDSPIVLADAIGVATAANDDLTSSSAVIALGGTGAVSDSVLAKVAYEAPATLAVESVSAINLIQLEVELSNTNYDEDEVKETGNYEFEGYVNDKKTDIDVVDVNVDGTTVTLTLKNAVDNQSKGTLTVDKDIIGEDVEKEVSFFDTELPTVKTVTVVGKDTVKVTFSEPINFDATAGIANSKFEDEFELKLGTKSFSVDEIAVLENGTEANVKVYGTFTDGDLTVSVDNGLEDYAGFNVVAKDYTVTVVEDTEAPKVVDYKDATREKVTLIFNEDITVETTDFKDFYHTNTSNDVGSLNNVKVEGNEMTLTFTDKLPEGSAYIYIAADAVSDLWDNQNDSTIKVLIDVDVDETKPEVDKVKATENKIEVTFSEELDSISADDETNYVLTDKDGDNVRIRSAVLGKNADNEYTIVTITPSETPLEEGTYTLEITDVEDKAENKMADYSTTFELEDVEAPTFPGTAILRTLDATDKEYELVVEFDEEMAVEGSYSILDLNKYTVGSVNLGKENKDNDKVDIEATAEDSNNTVVISISGLEVKDTDTLTIGRVADAMGNITDAYVSPAIDIVKDTDDAIVFDTEKPADAAQAVADDELKVKFDRALDKFEEDDFVVYTGAGAIAVVPAAGDVAAYVTFGGQKIDQVESDIIHIAGIETIDSDEVKLFVDKDELLAANVKNGANQYKLVVVGSGSENSYGVTLKLGVAANIKDKIKPEVLEDSEEVDLVTAVSDDVAKQGQISIKFSEPLNKALINIKTFQVNGGDLKVTDVGFADSDATVLLTVNDEVFENDSVSLLAPIYDVAGNKVDTLELSVESVTATTQFADAAAALAAAMVDYNAALAAVVEADYTTATWATYQGIVAANVVTVANTLAQVEAATVAITAAQADLVEIADLAAYNAALAAVVEADYTPATWATYQGIVAANVVTDQDLQADVDAATDAITLAQVDLVGI